MIKHLIKLAGQTVLQQLQTIIFSVSARMLTANYKNSELNPAGLLFRWASYSDLKIQNYICFIQDLASPDSIVSCTTASYICMAEPGCSTALQYYNNNCRAMFEGRIIISCYEFNVIVAGRKCNKRCKNSLEILMKQEQSRKVNLTKHFKCNHSMGFPLQLTNCICDGTETYHCENIRQNMER